MLIWRFYFFFKKDIKTRKFIKTQQTRKKRFKNQKLIIEQNDTVLNINFEDKIFFFTIFAQSMLTR